jgi:hypothetical protein
MGKFIVCVKYMYHANIVLKRGMDLKSSSYFKKKSKASPIHKDQSDVVYGNDPS